MYWLDGALYPDARAPFDLGDRGLTLGDGVFDTALVLNGRAFLAEAHLARLMNALRELGIDADEGSIRQCIGALAAGGERHVLRVTVTRGAGLRGLVPTGVQKPAIFGALSPFTPAFFGPPLAIDVAEIRRNETSPTSRLKTLSYLDAILAMRRAAARGCNEALFLNGAGRVACASIGNLFALYGDELATPPLADGALPGIIRGFLLEQGPALGLHCRERALTLEEFCAADAAFMTNSLRLIAPVERIGAVAIGAKGAKIVEALQDLLRRAIAAECGVEIR
ncbi:aminotransferase class IV [Methylocella silvestris BL2]|uniref:Probable branched-chain-amino-acid aminotransferase n=2 Tax=Methylocella silvestris TaxID=199596 RepID=B8EIR6_METSB|nr:aminotransferase class IV [Methylocella silvestris BL2]